MNLSNSSELKIVDNNRTLDIGNDVLTVLLKINITPAANTSVIVLNKSQFKGVNNVRWHLKTARKSSEMQNMTNDDDEEKEQTEKLSKLL